MDEVSECDTVRRNGVTFVRATVRNDRATPQIVELENRLDGPVWPPRLGDQTAPEWTDETWKARIEPGQSLGVGYATPAPPLPDEDPVAVVSRRRASTAEESGPEEVLASLDDWAPPSDTLSGDR